MRVENTGCRLIRRSLPFVGLLVQLGCGRAATPTVKQAQDTPFVAESSRDHSTATRSHLSEDDRDVRRGVAAVNSPSAKLTIRFSGIPDSDKDKLSRLYGEVARYLQDELGSPVEYVHVPDYTAAVTALAANKVDLVWLGGVTAVQAEARTSGRVEFLAAREEDLNFKSYLIARRKLVDAGKFKAVKDPGPQPLSKLAAMKPKFSEYSFTFGAKNSTSGHIMPRFFMQSSEVDIDPETDFNGPATFQIQGGHQATLSAVSNGAIDLGVLNYATWEAADEAVKESAPVIYVTPTYVDYCLVAHRRLGRERLLKLADAFVRLDENNANHRKVLDAFTTRRFVRVKAESWAGIRDAVAKLTSKGVLQ